MIESKPDISLTKFSEALRNGEVVAFPTETVYGLGADAWNADAVARIFALKGRPPDNPLIVHVGSVEMVSSLAVKISDDALQLMERFWPGPLTIIFPKRAEVLDIVTAGLPTVAVRMPDHPIPLRLISLAGPLAAPSANTSGRPSPTRAEHVYQDFGDDVPVIDGGSCQYGLESTVIDLSQIPYTVLRPGHITQSELEHALQQPVRMVASRPGDLSGAAPQSPGMKYTHYAPDAQVRWMKDSELPWPARPEKRTLYLLHRERSGNKPSSFPTGPENSSPAYQIIHYRENYTEMARDLYDRFRMADLQGFEEVAIEPFQEAGDMTAALLNRMLKAIRD
ncbi:MAG: L-threonylcarbamoyladenylate synthase [Balneolales bacterium]